MGVKCMKKWCGLQVGELVVVVVVLALAVGAMAAAQPRAQGQGGAYQALMSQQAAKSKVFQEQEAAEGKAFGATLAGMNKTAKIQALREFKTRQYEKNTAFRDEMFQERRAFLQSRTGGNPQASARLQTVLATMEKGQQDMAVFFLTKHQENMAFLDAVAADATLDGPALDEKIQGFFQNQKAAAKTFIDRKKAGTER